MDLYNFYKGLENVIDTYHKDRHDLTMKDYLIMCDPFFNVDFYDEKYLNQQIGGSETNSEKIAQNVGTIAEASETQIKQVAIQRRDEAEKEAQEAAEREKKAAEDLDEARKNMKKTGADMKKISKEIKNYEKKLLKEKKKLLKEKKDGAEKDGDTSNSQENSQPKENEKIKNLTSEINEKKKTLDKAKQDYQEAQTLVKSAQGEKQRAASKAESAKAVSDEDVADAAADLDKEVDEMAPIKNLIKMATKVVVVFAIIVCLPIVPWILISFYSFKKLYGLYISYIQTY